MNAEIIRSSAHYTDDGVFGALLLKRDDDSPALGLYTLEEAWRDNAPRVSCIPLGEYVCQRTIYHKYAERQDVWWAQFAFNTFEITGVPDRSRILFHPGNDTEDTEGCVLLGAELDFDARRILNSRTAFRMFMQALETVDSFPLTVRDA